MTGEPITTERDATLDTLAALDMYEGSFGSEETTIEAVEEGERNTIIVELSNGERYEIRVRAIS